MPSANLMIVEDEGLIAESIRRTLEDEGYTVSGTTGDGREAIELAEEQDPDLILMDQRLNGEKSGVETADEIQQDERPRIVFMTAYNPDKIRRKASDVSFEDVLSKPINDHELKVTIENALPGETGTPSE